MVGLAHNESDTFWHVKARTCQEASQRWRLGRNTLTKRLGAPARWHKSTSISQLPVRWGGRHFRQSPRDALLGGPQPTQPATVLLARRSSSRSEGVLLWALLFQRTEVVICLFWSAGWPGAAGSLELESYAGVSFTSGSRRRSGSSESYISRLDLVQPVARWMAGLHVLYTSNVKMKCLFNSDPSHSS